MLETSTVEAILAQSSRAALGEYLDSLDQMRNAPRRWEAITHDGVLGVPPDEYFVDAMISFYDLAPEASVRSVLGPCGVAAPALGDLPQCDVCKSSVARYDASVDGLQGSPWAFMCDACFARSSNRVLGNGVGQYLFDIQELTGPVRRVIEHISRTCEQDTE